MVSTKSTISLRLSVFLLISASSVAQSNAPQPSLPTDGNGLLDYCSHIVNYLDSPETETNKNGGNLTDGLMKSSWCAGYLDGIQDLASMLQVDLAIAAVMGAQFSGPDRAQQFLLESTRVACIPEKASIAQLARVLVKWLRDHPERLHEPKSVLTIDALKDAFPCKPSEPPKADTLPKK